MGNIAFNDLGSAYNLTMQFANGYELSISKGRGNYNGLNTAEIAVFKDNEIVRIEGQGDDVIGWVSADAIASVAYWVARGDLDAVRDALAAVNDRCMRLTATLKSTRSGQRLRRRERCRKSD
jgi:hypothetical protein